MTLRNVEGATPEQKRALLLKLVAEQQAGGASDSADQAPPAAVAQEKTARQREGEDVVAPAAKKQAMSVASQGQTGVRASAPGSVGPNSAGKLSGRVAVVTGSGIGIGRAVAERFAAEGCSVVVGDFNDKLGTETVARITAAGGKAVFQHVDCSDEEQIKALMERAVAEYGRLDHLVNNAVRFVFGHLRGAGRGSGTGSDRECVSSRGPRGGHRHRCSVRVCRFLRPCVCSLLPACARVVLPMRTGRYCSRQTCSATRGASSMRLHICATTSPLTTSSRTTRAKASRCVLSVFCFTN